VPNLKDIQRRIGSVKKTQQITRAMRMVAGAKLRRAQNAITAARPYAERMRDTVAAVAAAQPDAEHPLLEKREVKKAEVIVVTSDRGLCGAFNGNILKQANQLITERAARVEGLTVVTAGAKATNFFKKRRTVVAEYPQEGWVTYGQAVDIASRVGQRYTDGEVDEVFLVFAEFVSPMNQTPREVRLLPFAPDEADPDALAYEIEPNAASLLATLVPKALETEIFRALLENQAGEHAARMAAMESATRNTEDLIERLTLQYNRARQAAITKELVEIVSGAEAL
jgi:F-type H+-transporting ATPase subunit gamma